MIRPSNAETLCTWLHNQPSEASPRTDARMYSCCGYAPACFSAASAKSMNARTFAGTNGWLG